MAVEQTAPFCGSVQAVQTSASLFTEGRDTARAGALPVGAHPISVGLHCENVSFHSTERGGDFFFPEAWNVLKAWLLFCIHFVLLLKFFQACRRNICWELCRNAELEAVSCCKFSCMPCLQSSWELLLCCWHRDLPPCDTASEYLLRAQLSPHLFLESVRHLVMV